MDKFKQDIVAAWTARSFGLSVFQDRKERAARVVEEALELAQAEGLEWSKVERILSVVRDRPPGSPAQELGGVGVTLLAYAAAAGVDLEAVINAEILRVLDKPIEHFRKRHEEKRLLGISRGNAERPPIPPGVYYDPDCDLFYHARSRMVMESDFHSKWSPRRDEFEQMK